MNVTTALRTPYGSTTTVRGGATGRVTDATLRQAMVWARMVVVALCAARAAADWGDAKVSVEGSLALALLVAVTMWIAIEALDRRPSVAAPSSSWASPYR